eukprot:TRINITY_DN1174_c0_g1_i1.p1 TRINITY_DN1174_c0_g1~~TRINITY_DN1174_c0_g1_i1.p1  ORF type:complete len:183 (+),score=69.63 TRINITY_DN1174_c0_g1_i1:106-654(+)
MLKTEKRDQREKDKTEKQRKEREKREIARLQKESKERIKKEKKEREKRERKEKKKTSEGSVTPKKGEGFEEKKEKDEELLSQISLQTKEETSIHTPEQHRKHEEIDEEETKNALKKESSYVSDEEEGEVRREGGEYGETLSQDEHQDRKSVLSMSRDPIQETKVNNTERTKESEVQRAKESQ